MNVVYVYRVPVRNIARVYLEKKDIAAMFLL